MGYGIVELDPYVFVPNALGLLLGLFYTLSASCFADTQASPSQCLQHALLVSAGCSPLCAMSPNCQTHTRPVADILQGVDTAVLMQAQDRMIQVSLFFAAVLLAVGGVTAFAHLPRATNVFVWCALLGRAAHACASCQCNLHVSKALCR